MSLKSDQDPTIFSTPIPQRASDGFLNATEIAKSYAAYRAKNTGEPSNLNLSSLLAKEAHGSLIGDLAFKISGHPIKIDPLGASSRTWVHPILAYYIALTLDRDYDFYHTTLAQLETHLTGVAPDDTDEAKSSYKLMCEAYRHKHANPRGYHRGLIKLLLRVQASCDVYDWQTAKKAQRKMRDRIYLFIYAYSFHFGPRKAVNEAVHLVEREEMLENEF